jgi:hypothetical protein
MDLFIENQIWIYFLLVNGRWNNPIRLLHSICIQFIWRYLLALCIQSRSKRSWAPGRSRNRVPLDDALHCTVVSVAEMLRSSDCSCLQSRVVLNCHEKCPDPTLQFTCFRRQYSTRADNPALCGCKLEQR